METQKGQNGNWLTKVLHAAATRLLIALNRPELLGDSTERPINGRDLEVVETSLFALKSAAIRAVDPVAQAHQLTSPEARRRLIDQLYNAGTRTAGEWLLISSILGQMNLLLIPVVEGIGFLLGLMPVFVWSMAFRLQMNCIAPWNPKDTPNSMLTSYRVQLEARLNRLWTRDWDPGAFFWRSIAEAMFFLFMVLPLLFVVVQRFTGQPFPADMSWTRVAERFAASVLLLLLWIGVRKTHQATACVFQDEIEALSAAEKPV